MYATDYFERMILEMVRGQTATAPAMLYMALYLSNPSETGDSGAEVSYSGYLRQPITFSAPAPLNGGHGVQNDTDITFPAPDVAISNITHVGILDSAIGGNMLLYGAFTDPIGLTPQEAPVIIAGDAQWWITGHMSVAYRTKCCNLLRGQDGIGASAHLALFDGNPEDGGSELIGDNYARPPLAFTAPAEQPSGQSIIQNATDIKTPRAATNWGMLRYYAAMDDPSGGLPMMYMERVPYEMRKGRLITFSQGDFTLSIN